MSQSYIHFICKEEDRETAIALCAKLATEAKPGAIILLNRKEFDLCKTMLSVPIGNVVNPGVHLNDT